ncbi:hypothetical protein [Spirosoma telluris]|uniref:hypothetical protein n=1 Tax=Spirosoma telluris TaxID=2183553 RepID=UPI002FC3ADC6
MRGSILLRYSLPLLIALSIALLLLYPQLIQCLRVSRSANFRLLRITPGVYVHQTATNQQQKQLQQHIQAARDRIRQFWAINGGRQS